MSVDARANVPVFRAVSCSGASNAGEIADKVTRLLDAAGKVNMNCLTKIAIGDVQLIDKYKAAGGNAIAVDGCPVHCAKKILEAAGVHGFTHVTITDMGVQKGSTPVTGALVEQIAAEIQTHIGDQKATGSGQR
jgi:uncharacterized metal-binding protein